MDRQALCAVCREPAKLSCVICQRPICAVHRVEDACLDCASDEFVVEARLVRGSGKWLVLLGALFLPTAGLAIALESTALLAALCLGDVVIVGATEVVRRLRRKKRRQLPKPRPRQLPAADSQNKPDAGH